LHTPVEIFRNFYERSDYFCGDIVAPPPTA
jgi:hypothetical protein